MSFTKSLREHWPEYAIEAFCLGMFMISACAFTALLEHPDSPVHQLIANATVRRMFNGIAMGLTAVVLIYSPWGQRSGAHMNPAVTLTFWRLGKAKGWDVVFYLIAQIIGGTVGVLLAKLLIGGVVAHPSVGYVVTAPGPAGSVVAFVAEVAISGGMMGMILLSTGSPRLARFTGLFAGLLLVVYITLEAPLSGMSINPARSLASAIPSGVWTAEWIYLTAPIIGMLGAVELLRVASGFRQLGCAKLHHGTSQRCIFCGSANTRERHVELVPAPSPGNSAL